MRLVLINLERAADRRARMTQEFAAVGLPFEIKTAIDGKTLTDAHYAQVDREARRRQGLYALPDGSIANWLTQREVMRDLVASDEDMVGVFEDDARFQPDFPQFLAAVEAKSFDFDVILLHRRNPSRTFEPCIELAVHSDTATQRHSDTATQRHSDTATQRHSDTATQRHSDTATQRHSDTASYALGRVRYADYGSEGYIITREAARHFLTAVPKMVREIDQSLSRFWDNGLNVYYVDPPVAHCEENDDSQIQSGRTANRKKLFAKDPRAVVLARRAVAGIRREFQKRIAYRKLMRGEIGITKWS